MEKEPRMLRTSRIGTMPPMIARVGAGIAAVAMLAVVAPLVRTGPVSGASASQPPIPAAIVWVHTPLVDWTAAPGTAVEAVLERGGRVVATADGAAGPDGAASLALSASAPADAVVRPRDRLRLRAATGAAVTLTVPALVVAPDPMAGRVVGRAEGAAAVTVTFEGSPGAALGLTPDAGGVFAAPVDPAALAPGHRGWAERVDAGHRYRAEWVVFEAAVELTTPWVSGETTPGALLRLARVPRRTGEPTAMTVVGDGTRDGRARFAIGVRSVITPGSTVVVTQTLPLVPERSWRFVVPDVDVSIDAGARRVFGRAPAGTEVDVALRGPDGEVADLRVTAAGDGRYQASFAGAVIGPGWRASTTVGGGGLGARARASIPQVRAVLYDARVTGVGTPHGEAAVSLRRAGRPAAGPWRVSTAADGTFAIAMGLSVEGATRPLDLLPGDTLLVDLAGGDPIAIEVPLLTAIADAVADSVAGQAPPGTRLRVTAERTGAAPRDVTVGADGRWLASWAGEADIQPGDRGLVAAVVDGGHLVELPWATIGLTVDLATGELAGNAPPNRVVTATLTAPDGSLLGRSSVVAGRQARDLPWQTSLLDALGAVVPLREGDRLVVQVGDERIELTVPPLAGVVHVADDLVSGRTRPGGRLTVSVARPAGAAGADAPAVAHVTGDAAGGFAASFGAGSAAPMDVRFNDRVRLTLVDGPHRFTRTIDAPGLVVDVGNGLVRGSLEPGLDAVASLERDGQIVASRAVRTADDATFRVALRGPGDTPPAPGDTVILRADGAAGTRELRLAIDAHTLALDAGSRRVSGRTAPGARLQLFTHHAFGAAPDGGPHDVAPAPDGAWTWTSAAPLTPGTKVEARAVLTSGHILERSDTVAILSIQLGSDRVCGRGAPLAPVEITARDGALSAEGRADEYGGFALRLVAGDGSPAILAPTDRVQAAVGAAQIVAEPHGFHAVPDASGRGIQGIAEHTDWVALFHPVGDLDCRGTAAGAFPAPRDAYAPFADGRFRFIQRELATWLPEGIELAWFDRVDGHRRFWRSSALHVRLYIHMDRIAGTVAPGTELDVVVRRVDGAPRGEASARGRPDGRFEARIAGADGQPAALAIGDTVVVSTPDTARSPLSLVVQRLDLDFAVGTPIVGEAPASHPVDLRLFLTRGRVVDVALVADDTGGWAFGAADIPPRAGWSLGDIVGVRAELPLEGGHAIVVESGTVDGGPGSGTLTLFLPFGERP